MEEVVIDGSTGEGGGQILRTSLALSCVTGRSLHIENIRDARRNPGLAKQHLSCVRAACQICSAKCRGAALGSQVLDFEPGTVHSGDFNFDIGSAGSASLVIQTLLPPLFLADKPSSVTVTGGTHNPLAPPFDFLSETFLPAIAAGGFHGHCELTRHGFFPAGGGEINFNVQPWHKDTNKTIDLCQSGKPPEIFASIYIARLPSHIAQRQCKLLLQSKLNIRHIEQIEVTDSDGPGNCVMIRLYDGKRTTVFTAFGMRGKPSQKVVAEVVGLTQDFLAGGACVDRFLADQLLIYLAVSKAGTYTTSELSKHLQTNIDVIKKFLPVEFSIEPCKSVYKISCHPI
jgi:RNA 3'-terminal phosphate cyclase (ATP)